MFCQKYVTYFLLVLYGVPASIGPYWHIHHHGAQNDGTCCTVEQLLASFASGTTACTTEGQPALDDHLCHCTQHDHVGRSALAALVSPVLAEDCADCSDCLICRFYSSAPCIDVGNPVLAHSELIELLPRVGFSSPSTFCFRQLARGPPA